MARGNEEKTFKIAYQARNGKHLLLPCEPGDMEVDNTIIIGAGTQKLFYEAKIGANRAIQDCFRHEAYSLDISEDGWKIEYRGETYSRCSAPVSIRQPIVPASEAERYGALMRTSNGFLYVGLDLKGQVNCVWMGGRLTMENRPFEIVETLPTGTTFKLGDGRVLKFSAGYVHTNRFDGWLDWCIPGERFGVLHVPSRGIMQVTDSMLSS